MIESLSQYITEQGAGFVNKRRSLFNESNMKDAQIKEFHGHLASILLS